MENDLQINGWVIVADGAHARFMAIERHAGEPRRAALRLVEVAHISNPEHTVSGRRDSRKIKSGRDTSRGGLSPHGYTDHRDMHESELLRRFASRIADVAESLVAFAKTPTMLLVADPRMLGLLRPALEPVAKAGIALRELKRDYTWCSLPQLQRYLAVNGLLPQAS